MKLIDKFKNKFNKQYKNELSEQELEIMRMLGISPDISGDIKGEITYFTCLRVLSETLGKLPLKLYQETENGTVKANNNTYNIIKLRPNPYINPTMFWSTVERNRNHFGNAYVYCNWIGTQLKDLWILQSDHVRIMIDNKGYFGNKDAIYYIYNDPKTCKEYIFHQDNILHFKSSHTFDGIVGIAVQDILHNSIEGGLESQNFMNNLYKTGLTGKAILQFSDEMSPAQIQKFLSKLNEYASGANNAGKVMPIPYGMKLTPLDIKLTDSQFFELKKYNALQIASAFGIQPNFLNNYDKSSYSNSESQQLSFLINTMQFILKQYEEEVTYKLLSREQINQGYYFKFNEGALLRADSQTQKDVLCGYVNNAIYTPNEARLLLNMPTKEGGDILMCNGNYIPITEVGNQYEKGGVINE